MCRIQIIAAVTALLAAGGTVRAQTVDYTGLEELFGEPITTSVTGQPQRARDTSSAIEIITAEEIRRAPATDIPGILRRVAGINVLRWTSSGVDVSVRGYNSQYSARLLVLINGRQVYLDHYAMTAWNALPIQLNEIRQIEVVKGPNTALFGFNAVSGVINIVTFNPLYDDVDVASVGIGTLDDREASAVTTVRLGPKAGLRLSGGVATHDAFDTETLPGDLRQDFSREALSADALIQLTDASQLGLEASYSQAELTEMLPYPLIGGTDYELGSVRARYLVDSRLGLVEAQAYRNWTETDLAFSQSPDRVNNRITVVSLQDTFKPAAGHAFRLGAEYRNNLLDDGEGELAYDNYAASATWNWRVNDFIDATNAVRVDHLELGRDGAANADVGLANADYGRDFTTFGFNSGLVVKTGEAGRVRLAVGRGVQSPSLVMLGYQYMTRPGFFVAGDPSIDPAIVTNYEIGFDYDLSTAAEFRTALFYQTTDDVQNFGARFVIDPPNTLTFADNIGDSRMYGAEVGVGGELGARWRYDANYTFLQVEDDDRAGTVSAVPTFFEDTTPVHAVNLSLGFTHGRFDADAYAGYVSSTEQPRVVGIFPVRARVDGYVTLAGRVGVRLGERVRLDLVGTTLNHDELRVTSGPDVERRILGRLTLKLP